MNNIIQIEELVYTRLPRISQSEWLNMLSKQGVANDYALLLDDYLLIEQTDYRFSNGNYISSERTVYNIEYTTYDTAENTPNPDNTEEIITVRYDSTHDRYYVYYTHFPIEDIPHTPDLSHILSEADIPSTRQAVQAPAEKQIDTPVAPRPVQPAPQPTPAPKPQPAPQPAPIVTTTEQPKKKKWKRIDELKRAYESGKTLKQIVDQFECTPEGAIYQLKTYLNIEHPFETKPQEAPKETILGVDKSNLTPKQIEIGKGIERFKSFLVKWPRAKVKRLKEMYLDGCSAKEMMQELQCEKDELTFRLVFEVGAKDPFEECNKKPWDKEQDELLLYYYVLKNGDIPGVAALLRRSELGINKRLYDLIGRVYNGMPKETSRQSAQAGIRRYEWKIKREEIKNQIEADIRKIQAEEKRKAEDDAKKVNGFYRPGVQVNHPVWGFITVIKDDENVLIYTKNGIRKRVKK